MSGNIPLSKISQYAKHYLKHVLIKDTTVISDEQFKDLQALEIIEYGKLITSIGNEAFKNCKSLVEVPYFKDVTSIYSNSFNNCESLEEID